MAYRPIRGNITEALLFYYDIDGQNLETAIHKEKVYDNIKQYYIDNPDKGRDIAWAITAHDPVKEIIKQHVPAQLHDTITARKSIGIENRANKVRAYRYLKIKQKQHKESNNRADGRMEDTRTATNYPRKKHKTSQDARATEQAGAPRILEHTTAQTLNHISTRLSDDDTQNNTIRQIQRKAFPRSPNRDFYGENQSGTIRTIRLLELYAGTAPASRFVHSIDNTRVLSAAVDWSADTQNICVNDQSRHTNIRFDIAQMRIDDVDIWARAFLDGPDSQIDWIHASVDCSTFSNASACKATHRRPDGAPRSILANEADTSLGNLISILRSLKRDRPDRLITIENPENSSFTAHPSVRSAIAEGSFKLLYSHHCASAAQELDGKIAGPEDYRCPPVFPKKGSVWLTSGLPRTATLPRCNSQCRMMIPETNHHRLVICAPTERSLHEAQKKLAEKTSRSRIPLGLFRTIWSLWVDAAEKEDGFQERCSKCGDPTGEMLCCDTAGCDRIEHHDCQSVEEPPQEIKAGQWFCQNCRLRRQLETSAAGLQDGHKEATDSRPGEF
jgi:hypothetical protein